VSIGSWIVLWQRFIMPWSITSSGRRANSSADLGDSGGAKKLGKSVNPDYWPFPADVEGGKRLAGKAQHTLLGIRRGVLREQDWASEWAT
jgi:hypothetical protein